MPKSKKTGPSYNTPQGLKTRKVILEAAGKVFAEKGYQAATIQIIAKQSKVVVSMVMHHFGSKENLYLETIRHHILDSGRWDYIFSPLWNGQMNTAAEIDQAFDECVQRYLYKSRPGDPPYLKWLGIRLLMDDVPSVQKVGLAAINQIRDKYLCTLKRVYPQLDEKQFERWNQSFWSLLFFPTMAHAAICLQNGWKDYPPGYLEQWAKDIAFNCSLLLKAFINKHS